MNLVSKIKMSEDAVLPMRAHPDDVGYDLWITKLKKTNNMGVQFFGTGIYLQPPNGYYWEVIPRSSISKTGYVQANGFGVIDPNYTGEIIVPLLKISPTALDLPRKLPFKIGQLILRQKLNPSFELVKKLDDTDRGDGGFGSTGS